MKLTQLDLFSGIGGFHLGFEKAGFEIESYFSEIDKYAIDVYKNNFKNSKYVGSVTDVRGSQLPKIDLITFGSPCQDFSLAGKRRGMQGNRSSLISQAIRLIGECRPRVFIWENVKGTFSSNSGEDFWSIIQTFANIGGYRLEWQLLNTRWRQDNHSPTLTLKSNEIVLKSTTSTGYEIAKPGDAINLSNPNSKTRRGRVGKKQSQTLDTACNMGVYTDKIRRLTPIECERLQGFPDNWTKTGKELGTISDSQRYKMCGNAVTVDVVQAIANKIKLNIL